MKERTMDWQNLLTDQVKTQRIFLGRYSYKNVSVKLSKTQNKTIHFAYPEE